MVHKTAEAIEELIGNKITGEIVKRNAFSINNYKNSCNNSYNNNLLAISCDSWNGIPAEKQQETKRFKANTIKWNTTEYLSY